MKNVALIFLLSVVSFGLMGCAPHQPIQNIENAAVIGADSAEDVRLAIARAAASRGWNITHTDDNVLHAELHVRSHQARIRIPYSADSYSILYESSVNLNHRGNSIHANYNRWIVNLNNTIRRELASPGR